jgi:type IV fimbrial biogenesis protein FimT
VLKPGPPRDNAGGFTLVEVMVAVTIAAILLVVGVPTMRGVIENTRIRTVAESWNYGLQLARNEAVRLNTQVEFLADPTGWQVRRRDPAAANAFIVLHQASGKESTTDLFVTPEPADADRITFNSLGRMENASMSDGSAPFSLIDVESERPSGISGYRPLRIQILAGGMTRVCDPAVSASDPRACL